jgi:F-type H+-transporting ATPase subunit a
MSAAAAPVAWAVDIQIGHHVEGHLLGMTFNLDTIWCIAIAGVIVVALGFWARAQLTRNPDDHVPTKLQLIWEFVVDQAQTQVQDTLGSVNRTVVMFAVVEFFFILVCNWMEMVPSEINSHHHFLPAPTADTNLTYAMAVAVIVSVWVYGVRQNGLGGYLKHFLQPSPLMLPLNIIEEITKPISLALRLFGNIFAGGILLALIGSLTAWSIGSIPIGGILSVFFAILWKLFDMAIGLIQAFIFGLLTVLYFGMASGHGDHEESDKHDAHADDASVPTEGAGVTAQPELAA